MPIKRKIKMDPVDIDNEHSDVENVETDSKISEPPVQKKKRKREQTILWQTPYRPKNAKRTATTKRTLSNELGPESKKQPKLVVQKKLKEKKIHQVTDNYAPVPLPNTVLSLFQGPHRFPNETQQECLFAIGIPPTIFYITEGNTKLLEPVNFLTTDKLNNMVRRQKERKSLMDMTLNLTNTNNNMDNINDDQENLIFTSKSTSSTEKQLLNNTGTNEKESQVSDDRLKIKKDGTIFVKLDGRSKPIIFPNCGINLLRLPDFEN